MVKMSEREPLSPQQLRIARFKIIRNMLHNDPELAELVREFMGYEKHERTQA